MTKGEVYLVVLSNLLFFIGNYLLCWTACTQPSKEPYK